MKDLEEKLEQLLKPQLTASQQVGRLAVFLTELSPNQQLETTKWILEEYAGYTDVRVWAGLEYIKREKPKGLAILERLIRSHNPDDRDTALSILSSLQDPEIYKLAKPLMMDTWPYIRINAVDLLRNIYPLEAIAALKTIERHQESWVRKAVRDRLNSMSVD